MGKVANQSSVAFGGAPSLAVDGDTNPGYAAGSCTHTSNENNPWWFVDLQDSVTIARVEITNRNKAGE